MCAEVNSVTWSSFPALRMKILQTVFQGKGAIEEFIDLFRRSCRGNRRSRGAWKDANRTRPRRDWNKIDRFRLKDEPDDGVLRRRRRLLPLLCCRWFEIFSQHFSLRRTAERGRKKLVWKVIWIHNGPFIIGIGVVLLSNTFASINSHKFFSVAFELGLIFCILHCAPHPLFKFIRPSTLVGLTLVLLCTRLLSLLPFHNSSFNLINENFPPFIRNGPLLQLPVHIPIFFPFRSPLHDFSVF